MKKKIILLLVLLCISCVDEATPNNPDYKLKPNMEAESYGCGNIFVYQYLDDTKVLTVDLEGKKLELTKKSIDIDLTDNNQNISVVLEIAGNNPDSIYFNFCNDVVITNMGTTTKYKAISGKLTYSVSEDNPIKDPVWKNSYNVTIEIEDLHLHNSEKDNEITIEKIVFKNIAVGWLPG